MSDMDDRPYMLYADVSEVRVGKSNIRTVEVFSKKDVEPKSVIPGAVLPYALTEMDVEAPFDPVSDFAIWESGRCVGPLKHEKLRASLRHKCDAPTVCSKNVLKEYTEDVIGLKKQLIFLRNRIKEIRESEKDQTDFFLCRIKELEKGLIEGNEISSYATHQSHESRAARKALRFIGSQGPLNSCQLYICITTGMNILQISQRQILFQLKNLRLNVNDIVDTDKKKYEILCERILTAISDIITEI